MTEPDAMNKIQLQQAMGRAWVELNATLDHLTPEQLSDLTDANGWRVQDHIAHMAAWNNWALLRRQGRPSWEGLGVSEADVKGGDNDRINAAIVAANAGKTASEARIFLFDTHQALLALVKASDEAALAGPFRELGPNEPPDRAVPPLWKVIYETTADHYEDHLRWMHAYDFGEQGDGHYHSAES